MYKDDSLLLQSKVKELKDEIEKKEKIFENNVNEINEKNLMKTIHRRSSFKIDPKIEEERVKIEVKLKSYEAEIEYMIRKTKIVENDNNLKMRILEDEIFFLKNEIEKFQSDFINLKVQMANLYFDKESEMVKNHSLVNKLRNYINKQSTALASYKKQIK